ncbi:hypothetical protein BC832DRAFT_545555 [Gaertneriomyces semiglobifer]|nr:hypothetical protein BC832DRAFT_545555 [Gaertneriomyces semiglobifer]
MPPKSATSTNNKKKKSKSTPTKNENDSLLSFSEEDQLKIINDTGVLHKLPPKSGSTTSLSSSSKSGSEPFFLNSILLLIPLLTIHSSLIYLIHTQYNFESSFSVLKSLFPAPFLLFFIYVTMRFRHLAIMKLVFVVGSCAAGCLLIDMSTDYPTFGTMLRTPGLVVLWVYFVIMMDLKWTLVGVGGPALWYWKESIASAFGVGKAGGLPRLEL